MKPIHTILFFLFIIAGLAIGCKPENPKKLKPKITKTVKKPAANKKTKTKNGFWAFAKKELKLNDLQIEKGKVISAKYTKRINTLKKQNKWVGAKNKPTRAKVNQQKAVEFKKLYGPAKYKKWVITVKKWMEMNSKKK